MWHEARKQEKKIRCMLVDYQRRAQRRKDYYDKIKADPTQFLQLHGRPCKIHLDPAVCIAANSSATMMPWQGNSAVMIDRFDVRAHLDYIPDINSRNKEKEELSYEERQINYERYRILVQNDFFSIGEDKFLHQIHLEEKFGPVLKNSDESNVSKKKTTVAIGYNYEEDNSFPSSAGKSDDVKNISVIPTLNLEQNDDNDSESDIDLDLTVDVSKIETQQANELNSCAHAYGMITNDFFSFLNNDLEEAENMRIVKEQEEEKAMFSGRKSRKERRAFRERTLIGRKLSPPSYAWRKSPSYEDYKALVSSNRSRSKSLSPVNSGKITYITSFGGEDPPVLSNTTSRSTSSVGAKSRKDLSRQKIRSRSRSEEDRHRHSKRSRSSSSEHKKRLCYRGSRSFSSSRSRSASGSRFSSITKSRQQETDEKYKKRLLSRSRSCSEDKSKIFVPEPAKIVSDCVEPPVVSSQVKPDPVTIPRYYGRNKEESSSELSLSSDDESTKQTPFSTNKTNSSIGAVRSNAANKNASSDNKLTPQERLRRKRQVLLNKQFKADKRAEKEKILKMVQERIDRAEEMKEISIKLRRRQRILRHNDSPRRHSPDSSRSRSSSSTTSRSISRSPYTQNHRRNERYRSSSSASNSEDRVRNERKRCYKKYQSSESRSCSRSPVPSRSRNRSRSPRKSYSDEYDVKNIDRLLKNSRESDKGLRSKRYCTLSEEKELARIQPDNKTSGYDNRNGSKDDTKFRKEFSPKSDNRKRERTYECDRYRSGRSRPSRRSSSRNKYTSRYDY